MNGYTLNIAIDNCYYDAQVRARMRGMDPMNPNPRYSSFLHCLQETAKEGALTRGLSIVILRSATMAAITLPLYETLFNAIGNAVGE